MKKISSEQVHQINVNGTETLISEDSRSDKSSTGEQSRPGCQEITARRRWTKEENNTIMCYLLKRARKSCVLPNSVQEFIEIEAWLLFTFFICLHNQLSSIHSIFT